MATVKIIHRNSATNKAGKSPLRLRLLHKNKIKEITLPGARIESTQWDAEKQKVKNDKMLNLRIQAKKLEYETAINKALALGIAIDLNDIHYAVVSKTELKASKKSKNWNVQEYIKSNIANDHNLAHGTRKNYTTLQRLMKDKYPKLKLSEVDGQFMNKLEKALLKKGLKVNTVHSRLKCLKATVNHAYENRVIEKPDLRGFKLKKGIVIKQFLDLEECAAIYEHLSKLRPYSNDYNILRAFIWSCYGCGMRFGDTSVLTYEQLSLESDGSVRLTYKMRKTGKLISVVLNDRATAMIEKEKIGTKEMVFRLIPYSFLLEDADKLSAKIESRNAYVNKRLKLMTKAAGVQKKVTFHMSRHSFCSNCLTLGIDHFTIKEVAGMSLEVLESTYGKVVDGSKTKAMKLFD